MNRLPRQPALVVFDLDGTLLDTLEDIRISLNHALVEVGRQPIDVATARRCVGDGARMLVTRALALPSNDPLVDAAVAAYGRAYAANPTPATKPMPGALALLDALATAGIPAAICTNKPRAIAEVVLEAMMPGRFCAMVAAGDLPRLKPDPAPVLRVLELVGCVPGRAWMIGDGSQDVLAAHAAGVAAIGLLGGIGDQAALRAAAPTCLVERLDELIVLLRPTESLLRDAPPSARGSR